MLPEQLLTATLVPVEPRPEFVNQLKTQLLERAQMTLRPMPNRNRPNRAFIAPRWLLVAAGVGGLLSLIGMAALGVRRARAARLTVPPPQPAQ